MRFRATVASFSAVFVIAAAVGWSARQEGPVFHFRGLRRPRVLYVADTPKRETFAEVLRAGVGVGVTFAPLNYRDQEMHHLCDKPLEETKEDQAYVNEKAGEYVETMLSKIDEFDVVIAQFNPRPRSEEAKKRLFPIQQRLVEYVRKGGNLVFINPSWEITFRDTPLADVVPVRFEKHKAWTFGCGGATDHPLTRGIPLEVTGSHWYGPVYEPVDATCVPLTRNERAARFWYRRLPEGGQVVHIYQASGGKSQWGSGTNYDSYEADRPDDGAAWISFYRRLFYWLTHGDKAFPVLVKIALPPEASCRRGQTLSVPVEVENRSELRREVSLALEVSHRRSPRRITRTKLLSLQKGGRTKVALDFPVSLPCTDSYLLLKAKALDAAEGTILSESASWVPFVHLVPLTVETHRHAYLPGQRIKATVRWGEGAKPGKYTWRLYLVDRSGRALQAVEGRTSVEEGLVGSFTAPLVMPDGGPEFAASYWATAILYSGGQIAGVARTQVQLDRPWTMREQFQWSLWTWGGAGRRIELYQDAGFNALGYPGNPYTADRYGMRQYVEGTGINTFGVTIDHDNWRDVRAAMEKTIKGLEERGGPDARSKVLVSLGEESGFKGGWGMRYYWPEDKAPEHVQKVFDDYLRELYDGKMDILNEEWGTDYRSFDEIPLEKSKVRMPAQAFVTAQAWEAMQEKGQSKDVIRVDVGEPDPKRKYLAHSAPYFETYRFFDWYYQKYCDLATEVYRGLRNPVPLTIMSAPAGFYPKVDVYNFAGQGPFYPKESGLAGSAIARRDYGDVPGFSAAMWAYFDLRSLWSCTVLSSILAGNTHIDYWVDVPLTFNADLTHTRASFWTKALRRKLHPIEPILLHKRFAYTDGLGMFVGRQPLPKGITGKHFGSAISCNAPVYSALEKSGYMPKVVHAKDLRDVKVLVASYAQVLTAEEGRQISEFVRKGGLLITTPWLASCSPHGNLLTVYPAEETGLAELLGFRLLNTSQKLSREEVTVPPGEELPVPRDLTLLSKGRDAVLDPAPDVQVLARYEDGTPLLLTRQVGRGRIAYLNFVYDWDGWWNSFHSPDREAYRMLLNALVRSGGVRAEYFLAFESAEPVEDNKGWWGVQMKTKPSPGQSIAWWASQLYSDAGGRIRYLATFADHRSPRISARLHWAEPDVRIFDLLEGKEVPTDDGPPVLALRPGQAALWAITAQAPGALHLAVPQRIEAGKPLEVSARLDGADASSAYGLVLDVFDPQGKPSRCHSLTNVSAPGGRAQVEIPTAMNDAVGEYRIVATESMTRLQAEARFTLTAPARVPARSVLNPFPERASEGWPATKMASEQFLQELRKLRSIYDGSYEGLEAKYMLSYYLNVPFRPDNRHAVMRRLQRTPWAPHLKALADAIGKGERFYLLGEDLNADPVTGIAIDPFALAHPRTFVEKLSKMSSQPSRTVEIEGMTFNVLRIGAGALVTSNASVDRAAYLSSDFVAWHRRLKRALREIFAE